MLAGQAGSVRLWWKGMFNQKVTSQAHVGSWVFSSVRLSPLLVREAPPRDSHLLQVPQGSLGGV